MNVPTLVLADAGEIVPIMMFGGAALIIPIWLLLHFFAKMSRERTRREILAYVAEGSISPEDAEKLIQAGMSADELKEYKKVKRTLS